MPRRKAHELLFAAAALVCAAPQTAESVDAKSLQSPVANTTKIPIPCSFQGNSYDVGSTWHVKIKEVGTFFCVTCKCTQVEGRICTSQKCPVECKDPAHKRCCQICKEVGKEKNHINAHPSTIAPPPVCSMDGKQYTQGQMFSRLVEGGTCAACLCTGIHVECETCKKPDCKNPTELSDGCICHVCPPTAPSAEVALDVFEHKADLPVWMEQKQKRGKGCEDQDKLQRMEGETWNPIMGPFGPMYCVTCECKSGRIQCSRVCPDPSLLPCERPVRARGECCMKCPPQTLTPASPPYQHQMTHVTRTRNSKRQLHRTCLPDGSRILAHQLWMLPNNGDKTVEKFEYAIQRGWDVELRQWELKDGIVSYSTKSISFEEFQKITIQYKSKLLGAISEKTLERIKKREVKIRKHCTANRVICNKKLEKLRKSDERIKKNCTTECGAKIKSILNDLKKHPVPPGCLSGENAYN